VVYIWKQVGPITMCLNETYIKVPIAKNLSDVFPILNGLKQDVLLQLLSNFALEYAIRKEEDQEGMELNGTHQFLIYGDDVNMLDKRTYHKEKQSSSVRG